MGIRLQLGIRLKFLAVILVVGLVPISRAADNELTPQEKLDGWILLFDGKSLTNWMAGDEQPSKRPPELESINPHNAGLSMLVYREMFDDFVLILDFKISPRCNSGVFVRTFPLTFVPGQGVGYYGIEMQIADSATAGYYDTGALYDLVKPASNAMKPVGEWNHLQIACNKNLIDIVLNEKNVNHIDLDEWIEPNKRPDGTSHKFTYPLRDLPRKGYIGLQDHGADCWFKNIKLKRLS
jgi:hypothetical protein